MGLTLSADSCVSHFHNYWNSHTHHCPTTINLALDITEMSLQRLSHEPTAHLSLWLVLTIGNNLLSHNRWTSVIHAGMTVTNLWKDKHYLPHLSWKNILTYKRHLNLLGWHSYNVTTNIWDFSHSLITDLWLPKAIKTEKSMLYLDWLA